MFDKQTYFNKLNHSLVKQLDEFNNKIDSRGRRYNYYYDYRDHRDDAENNDRIKE